MGRVASSIIFLAKLDRMECDDFREILSKNIGSPMVPLSSPGQMADGNMANLSPTIPINISHDPARLRTSTLGRVVPPMRSRSIPSCLKSFMTYFIGHMSKCQVSTLLFSNMRSKHI